MACVMIQAHAEPAWDIRPKVSLSEKSLVYCSGTYMYRVILRKIYVPLHSDTKIIMLPSLT